MEKSDVYREYVLCGTTTDNCHIYKVIIARNKKGAIKKFQERTNNAEVSFAFSSYQVRHATMGKLKEMYDSVGRKVVLKKLKSKPKNVIKIGSV